LEIVDVRDTETSDATAHDIVAQEELKISEGLDNKNNRDISDTEIKHSVSKRTTKSLKKVSDSSDSPTETRPGITNIENTIEDSSSKMRKTTKRTLRKLHKEEEEEDVEEITKFLIDDSKSTSSSKYIVRKRRIIHRNKDQSIQEELFEDTFTIPLHKFNLNLILSQTKIQNMEETVIIQRRILRQRIDGDEIEIEEISLPADSVNLETVLPMIDYSEICNVSIIEMRRQIIRKKVKKVSKIETNFDTEEESESVPDLEPVQVRSGGCRLTIFASLLLNPKEGAKEDLGRDRVEKIVQSIVQEGVRFIKHAIL